MCTLDITEAMSAILTYKGHILNACSYVHACTNVYSCQLPVLEVK